MESAENHLDDAALAAAGRDGDGQAFERLIDKYHRLIYKVAYNKCGNRTDAEDVTQEIFLHAHRSLPRLRDPHAFLGWLLAIAHNRANRFCRLRKHKIVALEEARRELAARHAERQPDPTGAEREESRLTELIRSLPEEFRLALTWKYLEGCSYDEIGMRLSLSFHQVDYLLRKAKSALRRAARVDDRRPEGIDSP